MQHDPVPALSSAAGSRAARSALLLAVLLAAPAGAQTAPAPAPNPPSAKPSSTPAATPAPAKPSTAPAKPSAAPAPAKPSAAPEATPANAKPGAPPASAKPNTPARAARHASQRPEPGPRPGLSDTVVLRDGTRLRGTLLRVEPGNYVLLLGIEGVRTVPWRVVDRVENSAEPRTGASKSEGDPGVALLAPCCGDELADEETIAAEDAWANLSVGWDLRAEGASLFKHYTVDDRGVWYGGEGWGGGGSISMHFRGPAWLGGGSSRFAEFELGVGDSLHSVSWKEGTEFQTDFLENETSLILGAHLGAGHWNPAGGSAPWSGVVVGIAWVPTYVRFFGSTDFDSTGKLHPAGLRMTLDWGRISPTRKGRVPGLRAAFTWLPYVGNLPTLISFGLGAVFY